MAKRGRPIRLDKVNKHRHSTVGKSTLGFSFHLDGLDKYFENIQNAAGNIDEACAEAIDEGLKLVLQSAKEGAHRHRQTGEVEDNIEMQPAEIKGNYITGRVYVDFEKHPEALEGLFQEYGDGHSPQFPDPFMRNSLDHNKAAANALIKKVLKRRGFPLE